MLNVIPLEDIDGSTLLLLVEDVGEFKAVVKQAKACLHIKSPLITRKLESSKKVSSHFGNKIGRTLNICFCQNITFRTNTVWTLLKVLKKAAVSLVR